MMIRNFCKVLLALMLLGGSSSMASHRVLLGTKQGLTMVEPNGEVSWNMKWGKIHDLHVGESGHIYVQQNYRTLVKIDPKKKKVIWEYDAANSNGNEGRKIELHGFQPLANGNFMLAESGSGRFIEITPQGSIVKETSMKLNRPNAHRDTRLARQLPNGNYLASHEGDGFVREYDAQSGKVIWEFEVPLFKPKVGGHGPDGFGNSVFSAIRLKNGNTLIGGGNNHAVYEVDSRGRIVWTLHQKELPEIVLSWVTTVEVLDNGNYVIGNCHAGPDQPILVEIEPRTKKVVWTLDKYHEFGNNVSNSIILSQR